MDDFEYFVAEEFISSLCWTIYCMGDCTGILNWLIYLKYAEAKRGLLITLKS